MRSKQTTVPPLRFLSPQLRRDKLIDGELQLLTVYRDQLLQGIVDAEVAPTSPLEAAPGPDQLVGPTRSGGK